MAKKHFIIHPDTIFIAKVYGAIILGALFASYCDAKPVENNSLKQNQSTDDSVTVSRVLENVTDTTKLDLEHKQLIKNITHTKLEKQK